MPDFTGKLKRRGRREDQGVHPGHGRRDPAEVGDDDDGGSMRNEIVLSRAEPTGGGA